MHYVEDLAYQLRCDVVKVLAKVGSGHLGGCLSSADIVATLFGSGFLKKENINQRAVYPFVLSVGHLAPLLYSALARMGEFPLEELWTLRRLGSRLQGHPSIGHGHDHEATPGLFCGSGSLGQGLSIAAGMAVARPATSVYALLGDGELQEGQIWEAAMFAAYESLDNLVAIVDVNGQQLDGPTWSVMNLLDIGAKWRAFGWEVYEIDGHSCEALAGAVEKRGQKPKPKVILAKTRMGCGIPAIENLSSWHGKTPSLEQVQDFLLALENSYSAIRAQDKLLPLNADLTVNVKAL